MNKINLVCGNTNALLKMFIKKTKKNIVLQIEFRVKKYALIFVIYQKKEEEDKQRKLEVELRNKEELEKYEKKLQGRKKHRDRRAVDNVVKQSFISQYWIPLLCVSMAIVAIVIMFILK